MHYICNSVTKLNRCKHIAVAGLLGVMLLSIMPKNLLHDVFADHTDITSCSDTNLPGPCIHNQGYNCKQSDIVVPTFYLSLPLDCIESINLITEYKTDLIAVAIYGFRQTTSARGPPAHV